MGWHFPDLDKHFAKSVLQYPDASYQQATIDEALKHVKKFDCAIDVGANIGLHTVRFANKFQQVHSFEPTDTNFECLKKNTDPLDNVTLHQMGLGNEAATLKIKLPADANNCGNFSLIEFDNYAGPTIEQSIAIETLDSFDFAPGLIKIDVQGFDYNVLVGAIGTIKLHNPVIIIESETKKSKYEIADLLTAHGFAVAAKIRQDQIWVHQ